MAPYENFARSGETGKSHRGCQTVERLCPVVTPNLEVDVDHVVGCLGQAQKPIGEVEGPLLAEGRIVPDNSESATEVDGAKSRRRRVASEIGTPSRVVGDTALTDRDLGDGLTGPQWNLPVCPGERPVEVIGDVLGYEEGSVRFDDDLDVRLRQAEFLCKGRQGRKDDRGSDQNCKEAPPPYGQDRPPD
jgi:hypothetical protein